MAEIVFGAHIPYTQNRYKTFQMDLKLDLSIVLYADGKTLKKKTLSPLFKGGVQRPQG